MSWHKSTVRLKLGWQLAERNPSGVRQTTISRSSSDPLLAAKRRPPHDGTVDYRPG